MICVDINIREFISHRAHHTFVYLLINSEFKATDAELKKFVGLFGNISEVPSTGCDLEGRCLIVLFLFGLLANAHLCRSNFLLI